MQYQGHNPGTNWEINLLGGIKMNDTMLKIYIKIQNLMAREEGQDLVEYALVVALLALAATTGMKSLATAINLAFTNIGTTLGTSIT
jgi:pilus assembly protein Flp/PilA